MPAGFARDDRLELRMRDLAGRLGAAHATLERVAVVSVRALAPAALDHRPVERHHAARLR